MTDPFGRPEAWAPDCPYRVTSVIRESPLPTLEKIET
jgi:hypothetical protein